MNSRISTSMMYQQSIASILSKQGRLHHLNQQLSSNVRLVSAKDDPVAMGAAMDLDRSLAALEQYHKNATLVQSRLGMQENALEQVSEVVARVKDLTIEANNGSRSPEDHQSIARELRELKEALLHLANSTDGNARYLFAGTLDATAPFTKPAGSGGQVVYGGDHVQRQIEIAPNTVVKDIQSGSDVFTRIRTGDGIVNASADNDHNTGTGVILDIGRSGDTVEWSKGLDYTVQFDSNNTYTVYEHGVPVHSGTHKDGEDITFAGLRLRIGGVPAPGDSFRVGQAENRDIFSTLDNLIDALEQPAIGPVDQAELQNALHAGLRDVNQASEHFINARTTCGAQLAQIDMTAELRAADTVTLQTSLSAIRDLDAVAAISDYQQEKVALQIAQIIFTQMQGMSLFDRMR